jgi:hypothetical protein
LTEWRALTIQGFSKLSLETAISSQVVGVVGRNAKTIRSKSCRRHREDLPGASANMRSGFRQKMLSALGSGFRQKSLRINAGSSGELHCEHREFWRTPLRKMVWLIREHTKNRVFDESYSL